MCSRNGKDGPDREQLSGKNPTQSSEGNMVSVLTCLVGQGAEQDLLGR